MIDFSDDEIFAERRTADGKRFVFFLGTDVLPYWEQRFWTVVLDTGADGVGIPVRYGTVASASVGWSLRQLLCVAKARMALEQARAPEGGAQAVLDALGRAIRLLPQGDLPGGGVSFAPGVLPSPYSWTEVRYGELDLGLCPDPESRDEGIAPEQLLIVVDEALREWSGRAPYLSRLWTCRNAVREALAAEIRRVRLARGAAEDAGGAG